MTREARLAARHARALLACAIVIGVVAFVAWRVARLGYNPSDDGLITSESFRILHGQVPHADFVTARPALSAVLHTVDVLLPTPLVLTSRVIALAEIALYTMLFARLTYDRPVAAWSIVQAAAAVGAFVVNVHTLPLQAWHTIDGLLLIALGLTCVHSGIARERQGPVLAGMVALGASAVAKQSFAPAAVIGLVLIVMHDRRRPRHVLLAATAAAAPVLAYATWVSAAGSARDMVQQLTGAKSVFGGGLFTGYRRQSVRELAVAIVVLALATLVSQYARRPERRSDTRWSLVDLGMRVVATGVVVHVVLSEDLRQAGTSPRTLATWGTTLMWLLVVHVVIDARPDRRVDALLILAVAWMSSLSWGYWVPNQVAGSIALVIVERVWRAPPRLGALRRPVIPRVAAAAATVVIACVVMTTFLHARSTTVYRDLPASDLTADLGTLTTGLAGSRAQDLRGIRTNESTYSYLQNALACIYLYPADRVAILPANAGLYAALHLHNPFSVDWAWTDELVADAQDRMLADARRLSQRGDYLVLFQTAVVEALAYYPPPPPAGPHSEPYFYGLPLGNEIRDALGGRTVLCGSFIAVYEPHRAPAGQ